MLVNTLHMTFWLALQNPVTFIVNLIVGFGYDYRHHHW